MRYPVTEIGSVEAVQLKFTWVLDAAVADRFVGALGGCVLTCGVEIANTLE
jgi:hypothetical protein